jgi:type IV pilus assembly protein PilY1
MVLFGTGKYLEVADKTSSQQHTFYGIWDNGSAVSPDPTRSNLQAQYLVSDSISSGGVIYSTSTRNAVDWDTKKGWYLDLTKDGSNPSERVAYDPQILGTILNFVTVLPSTDVCAYGGDSYDFLLDPITGGSLDYAAFSGITAINTGSYGTLFASRRKSTVGISPTGTTITVGKGSGYEYKGGSTGNIEKFGVTLKAAAGARLSWRELSTD